MIGKRMFVYPLRIGTLPSGRKAVLDGDGYLLNYAHPDAKERVYTQDEMRALAQEHNYRLRHDEDYEILGAGILLARVTTPSGIAFSPTTGEVYTWSEPVEV